MVEALEIVVPLVNTKDNDADFFTKPLAPKRFKMLRRRVMNLSDAETPCEQRPRGGRWNAGGLTISPVFIYACFIVVSAFVSVFL